MNDYERYLVRRYHHCGGFCDYHYHGHVTHAQMAVRIADMRRRARADAFDPDRGRGEDDSDG